MAHLTLHFPLSLPNLLPSRFHIYLPLVSYTFILWLLLLFFHLLQNWFPANFTQTAPHDYQKDLQRLCL